MDKEEGQLLDAYQSLDKEAQKSLIDYAQFLISRHGRKEKNLSEPQHIEAPENESVVAAIKRLSKSYSMLDKSKMLHETSALMAEHVVQGRDAAEVISDLEVIFQKHYQKAKSEK